MTRWWTYAVLAIALLFAGSVRAQAPQPRPRCELRQSANTAASSARKRSAKAPIVRRGAASVHPLAVVPDRFELVAPALPCTRVVFVDGAADPVARAITACSRAPPHG